MRNFIQHGPYIAIDFETSASVGACACAVGLARIENHEVTDTYYSLIRPPSSRVLYTFVHGLTWKDLKGQRPFGEVWPEIAAFCRGARFFVAHNASFDRRVLLACCRANHIAAPRVPFLCTLLGARRGLDLARNNLSAVCEYFGIVLNHHHAGSDALACAHVHIKLRELGISDEDMKLNSASRKTSIPKKIPSI